MGLSRRAMMQAMVGAGAALVGARTGLTKAMPTPPETVPMTFAASSPEAALDGLQSLIMSNGNGYAAMGPSLADAEWVGVAAEHAAWIETPPTFPIGSIMLSLHTGPVSAESGMVTVYDAADITWPSASGPWGGSLEGAQNVPHQEVPSLP